MYEEDNYSDNMEDNFEEEYLDEEPMDKPVPKKQEIVSKPSLKQPLTTNLKVNSTSNIANKQTPILTSKPVVQVSKVATAAPKGIINDDDDDDDDYAQGDDNYEDDDFDEDEEENFKVRIQIPIYYFPCSENSSKLCDRVE
jgi:hypothetical protein